MIRILKYLDTGKRFRARRKAMSLVKIRLIETNKRSGRLIITFDKITSGIRCGRHLEQNPPYKIKRIRLVTVWVSETQNIGPYITSIRYY